MVIKTNKIIAPIPKPHTFFYKLWIAGQDLTSWMVSGEFTKMINIGTGSFKISLSNIGGKYSEIIPKGTEIIFYADISDGTLRQFKGRVDYPKERTQEKGQFLELEGRHISYRSSEIYVSYEATDEDPADILKNVIVKELQEYTVNNVNSTGLRMTKTWNYVPFWQFVKEVSNYSGYDCYIDDDLDTHFFEANSIVNDDECVANYNHITNEEVGEDEFYEKTRVIAMGQDAAGIPIMYTAKRDDEGDTVREYFIKDSSAKTEDEVISIAEAKLSEILALQKKGRFASLLLETLELGQNIRYILPRQKISSYYKIWKYTIKAGNKEGAPKTITYTENQITDLTTVMNERIEKETRIQTADNPNKLEFSYNIDFSDSTKILSLSDCVVEEGKLKLAAGKTEGTAITVLKITSNDVTNCEMRYEGKDINNSNFIASFNNGTVELTLTNREFKNLIDTEKGREIYIKIVLRSDTTNTVPEVDSVGVLFT